MFGDRKSDRDALLKRVDTLEVSNKMLSDLCGYQTQTIEEIAKYLEVLSKDVRENRKRIVELERRLSER